MTIKRRNPRAILFTVIGGLSHGTAIGDDLKGRDDLGQLASRLRREIDLLAAEYDNALHIMQNIGLEASKGRRSLPPQAAPRDADETEQEREAPRSEEPVPPADDGERAADDVRKLEQADEDIPFRTGEGRIAEVPADWEITGNVNGRNVRPPSVRAIQPGGMRFRIAPITREKPREAKETPRRERTGDTAAEEKLVRCPGCGAEVSERSVVCVSCGEFLRR